MISLVIPVYKNEKSIPPLLEELDALAQDLAEPLEVIFVVDGSPDDSLSTLRNLLPCKNFKCQLLSLARNFGSFAAIRAGLEVGRGQYFAVMAADLQEPPSLIAGFHQALASGNFDVVLGERTERDDPAFTKICSGLFWRLFRLFINPSTPTGGVDIFGCSRAVRDQLLCLRESNSSLVGLLLWVGFRRTSIPYTRKRRVHGKSAWTFRRKLNYLFDSCMSFTDLPIKLLLYSGLFGLLTSFLVGVVVLFAKITGYIVVPGYTPIILGLTFFGGLNSVGLGIIGSYVWRTFENTKCRPLYIVRESVIFD